MSIIVTDKAVKEIKKIMQEQNISFDDNVLEVGVAGGGCSGFSYSMKFIEKKDIDSLNSTKFSFEGLEAVVDNKSMLFLEGTTLDFYEDINKRGFVFSNPNATKSCGCGQSFSV